MTSGSKWLACAGLGLVAACQSDATDTCGYATDELSIVAVVVDRGDVVRAEMDVEPGDRTVDAFPLSICGDDELRINGQTPIRTDKDDRIVYSANLGADARTVTFALSRPEDDVTIAIDVPDAFELLAPAEGDMLSRSADLVFAWEPPVTDGMMRIELGEAIGGGVCIYTEAGEHHYKDRGGVDVPDTGKWTVPGGSVHSDTDADCEAYYTLQRIVQGDYPDVLESGGFVEARVERTVTFTWIP